MPELHPSDEHDDADPRLAPLLAWRQQLVDSGAVAPRSLKESHLRLVLKSGRTDAEQIRAMLPGSASQHADEMARILGELAGQEEPASPGRHRSTDEVGSAATNSPRANGQVHDIELRRQDGAVDLSWPDYSADVVLYRVVSSDQQPPKSPDDADAVAATGTATARDDRPLTAAARHYQVWVCAGTSEAKAIAADPVLYAAGTLISPVSDFVVREDGGWVVGQWTTAPGVSTVHVFRVPVEEIERDEAQYRILAGSDNLAGFVDTGPARGQRYRYRARCAFELDGVTRLSEAAEADVELAAALAPVTDIAVETAADGTSCDLSWTPPAGGQVIIYRTPNGPSAGAEAIELPEGALEQVGLTPELRLAQAIVERSGPDGRRRAVITGVTWPSDWSRAYFTPVTTLGGRAMLGRTMSSVRTGTIRDIELAEYCNKQILTFDWPDGAAGVVVYLAPTGHDLRAGLTGKSFEISLEEYERYGGMHLTGQLPVGGCSLHLAPVAFSGGRRVVGAITSIEYPGLLRLQYAVRIGRDPNGFPTTATVALRSEHDVPGSPNFVLVNNPQRLPLSVHDGQPVDVAPLDARGQLADLPSKELRWSALTTSGAGELWAANLSGLQGWVRLFINIESPAQLRGVALLDPPVETLRLTATSL